MAQQLIESLTTEFKPEKYKDEYRARVMELIEKKSKGQKIVNRPERETATPRKANDLIAALEASLAKTKSAVTASRTPRRRKSA